jgi:hypothetical protein
MPSTNENMLPTAKLRSLKARKSTIGCRAMSTRAKKIAAEHPEITAAMKTVSSSSQS